MKIQYIKLVPVFLLLVIALFAFLGAVSKSDHLTIMSCEDFEVNGRGDHAEWDKADWFLLEQRKNEGAKYDTKMKMLYSETGVYLLYSNEDAKITSTMTEDFDNLWEEDVVEVFFWTDEKYPFYFEYELSPNNKELPIMVPNVEGDFLGWKPWNYEGERLTRHATFIQRKGKKITGWTAEFFIPYELMKPLANMPPKSGTEWRANMYRIDYDEGVSTWTWKPITTNFHDYKNFGIIKFE